MRTIIAGSRTITDQSLVEKAIADSGFKITMVYSGRAPGVDSIGESWAKDHGVCVKFFPAEWGRYGKMAGPLRNQSMVNRAEALIAVWDGSSKGTSDVIRRAKAKGIPVFVLDRSKGCVPTTHVNQHTETLAKPSEVPPSNGCASTAPRPGETRPFQRTAPERHSEDRQSAPSRASSTSQLYR